MIPRPPQRHFPAERVEYQTFLCSVSVPIVSFVPIGSSRSFTGGSLAAEPRVMFERASRAKVGLLRAEG